MRLAVAAQGQGLDARLDPRFGRCAYFVLVDTNSGNVESIPNPGGSAAGGAGVKAAEHLASLGLTGVVVAREVGPNAARVLNSAGVSVYEAAGETVREAVEALRATEGK